MSVRLTVPRLWPEVHHILRRTAELERNQVIELVVAQTLALQALGGHLLAFDRLSDVERGPNGRGVTAATDRRRDVRLSDARIRCAGRATRIRQAGCADAARRLLRRRRVLVADLVFVATDGAQPVVAVIVGMVVLLAARGSGVDVIGAGVIPVGCTHAESNALRTTRTRANVRSRLMQVIGVASSREPSVVRAARGSSVYVAIEGLRAEKVRDRHVSLSITLTGAVARQLWRKLGGVLTDDEKAAD